MGKGARNRAMRRIGIKPRTIPHRPNRARLRPEQIEARLHQYASWLHRQPKAANPTEARRGRH